VISLLQHEVRNEENCSLIISGADGNAIRRNILAWKSTVFSELSHSEYLIALLSQAN
jgi:hypothetical protein